MRPLRTRTNREITCAQCHEDGKQMAIIYASSWASLHRCLSTRKPADARYSIFMSVFQAAIYLDKFNFYSKKASLLLFSLLFLVKSLLFIYITYFLIMKLFWTSVLRDIYLPGEDFYALYKWKIVSRVYITL
jgi:hypothetical protein